MELSIPFAFTSASKEMITVSYMMKMSFNQNQNFPEINDKTATLNKNTKILAKSFNRLILELMIANVL